VFCFVQGKAEEEAMFTRCSNKKIYLNIAVNTIKRLRTEAASPGTSKKGASTLSKVSHNSMLDGSGPGSSTATYTVNRSGGGCRTVEEDFHG